MKTTSKTKVIFRKWNNGDIIALFPQEPSDVHGHHCMSYEHVGQHGGASYDGIILQSTLATPDEYSLLKRELESIGYVLTVGQKESAKDRQLRRDALKKSA